jgi:hypothetical protein
VVSGQTEGRLMSYQVNDFGAAKFQVKKKGKPITGFDGYGKIIDIDSKCVLFQDNDGFEFIVKRVEFNFEVKEFVKK